jgi:CRP-like cAMP-binding protein
MYERLELPPGSIFIRENEKIYDLYLVVSGSARATRTFRGKMATVAYFGKGDVVGEQSLLTGEPRSATVEALTAMELIKVSFPTPLDSTKSQETQLLTFVMKNLIARVRFCSDRITSLEASVDLYKLSHKPTLSREYVIPELQRFLLSLQATFDGLAKDAHHSCLLQELSDGVEKLMGPTFLEIKNLMEVSKLLSKTISDPGRVSFEPGKILEIVKEIGTHPRYFEYLNLNQQELEILLHIMSHFNHLIEVKAIKVEGIEKSSAASFRLADIKSLTELSRHPNYFALLRSLQKKDWLAFEAETGTLLMNIDAAHQQLEVFQLLRAVKLPVLKGEKSEIL